ncbi:MAG: alpha/beta hydrolase [Pseudomonadota bacterium]
MIEQHYATLKNGHKLHYIDEGTAISDVDAVVFLHGSGSGASGYSNFKTNYPDLVSQGHRVIVPDHIGYGYSDKPEDAQYHVNLFVECIYQLVESLGLSNIVLVGNSLGGAIGIRYTLDHAEQVAGLLLMAPGGIEEQANYFTMPAMQIMKETFVNGKSKEALADFTRKALVENPDVVTDELIDERWAIAQLQNNQVIETMVVPNMSDELKDIDCPVLALWGLDDKLMPETGIMTLSKNIKNIKMVLVSNCGHWVMVEHNDLFNRYMIDFVNNVSTY